MPNRLCTQVAFLDKIGSRKSLALSWRRPRWKKPSAEYSRIRLDVRLYRHNCFRTSIKFTLLFRVCPIVEKPRPVGNRRAHMCTVVRSESWGSIRYEQRGGETRACTPWFFCSAAIVVERTPFVYNSTCSRAGTYGFRSLIAFLQRFFCFTRNGTTSLEQLARYNNRRIFHYCPVDDVSFRFNLHASDSYRNGWTNRRI